MSTHNRFTDRAMTLIAIVVFAALASMLPAAATRAAPLEQPPVITLELEAMGDARTQGGSPNTNFGGTLHYFMTANGHYSFAQFDLNVIPANTVIQSAELQFEILLVNGTANDVEVGVANGPWDEATLTWATQPGVTWGGPVQTIDSLGVATWDVTRAVKGWHENGAPNHGFALHGNGGDQIVAGSKESSDPPRLVVTFGAPSEDDKPRPDLGDAPDSSNHVGIANTAYPGVNGRFPTVWDVPAGQPAGPRHANQSIEAILGDHLSRENEADGGPDQDGPNNILAGGADNADNDRGDDGWRNRRATFDHCESTTLRVRVRKAPNATRNLMYLNVWFDGEHDGDWDGMQRCRTEEENLDVPAYEWIVQNHVVDMTGIASGGYVDIDVNTEMVLNSTPDKRHWTRFVLSEERAVSPGGVGLPDGRGPHPASAPGTYRYGETEDYLQRPQPQGEEGTLELEKRVLTDSDPVGYADSVTYQIRLRHVGGTDPIKARIEDQLPYPLHILSRINDDGDVELVTVEGTPGGVSPLQATIGYDTGPRRLVQIVRWNGTLAPNSEVTLSFDVHVHPVCGHDQQTVELENVARAKARGGDQLSAAATFMAACPGYTTDDIGIEVGDPIEDINDLEDVNDVPWQAEVWNKHPVPVTLGFFQPTEVSASDAGEDGALRFLDRVTLDPDERRMVEIILRMELDVGDELMLPDDFAPTGRVVYCILPGEENVCPDAEAYPHLVDEAPPITLRVRPNDLGDAPDSTNHFGVAMAAYAGVQANFPTVFDPATGLPEGPRHSHPRPFHLGERVSRESEADVGPDQDPTNNLEPAANTPNLDRADDGSRLRNLANCRRAAADVQVFVSPRAATWFAEQQKKAYLNVWIDSNRDGDWADGFTCADEEGQTHEVVEHILIDFPVDVAALGAGLHNLPNIATQRVPWPAQLAEQSSWIRFTLSERESNKTLQFGTIKYGDGRGYDRPFRTGETEDHRWRPTGGPEDGPDMAVDLSGRIRPSLPDHDVSAADAGVIEGIDSLDNAKVVFKIDYENVGSRTASGALLEFQIPEKLHDAALDALRAPGVAADRIERGRGKLTLALPDLAPGAGGTVILGWRGCLTCTVASSIGSDELTAVARIRQDGDVDLSNNEDTVTLRGLLSSPIMGMLMDYSDDGKIDHLVRGHALTCRTEPRLGGRAKAGMAVEILIDGTVAGTVNADANGRFGFTPAPLSTGDHRIGAHYPDQVNVASIDEARFDRGYLSPHLWLHVDPSFPFDPVSLHFTDSQGRVLLPTFSRDGSMSLLGLSFDVRLRKGETYTVAFDTCPGSDVASYRIVVGNVLVSSMTDEDEDGRFEGSFTYDDAVDVAAAGRDVETQSITLVAVAGSTETAVTGTVSQPASGVVRNRDNGQPLPNASIVALSAQEDAASYAPWDGSGLGQPNPVQSDGSGAYSLDVEPGLYRLDVSASGFQPYRTGDIDVAGSSLAADVSLTPAIAGDANRTIYVDESGFSPSLLTVEPGSVVEWVNVGLEAHAVAGDNADSGLLDAGESYKVKLTSNGTFTFADGNEASNGATIVVSEKTTQEMMHIYLPMVVAQ